jgi:uncharacterized membrane protein
MNYVFAFALGIGIVAGLRSLTAPAAVSWAAHLGWLSLRGSPVAFMGSTVAVVLLSLAAIVEFVADLLPKTPNRTAPVGLIARIVTGALSGTCICAAATGPMLVGAVLGAIGAVIGAFAGYQVRARLVNALGVKDAVIGISEDLVAIGLAYFFVSR